MNRLSVRMLFGAMAIVIGLGFLTGIGNLLARETPSPPAIFRIAEKGRLTLEQTDLPQKGELTLLLSLNESVRGGGVRTVRIITVDGRRLDTTARRSPAEGSDLRLEIDPAFLTTGLYMIEMDSEESHPLTLRRWVVELR
ncbi:MAG: hypothetical protein GY910_26065 [bacterium]|nr:hypothetical protein [bacterium]